MCCSQLLEIFSSQSLGEHLHSCRISPLSQSWVSLSCWPKLEPGLTPARSREGRGETPKVGPCIIAFLQLGYIWNIVQILILLIFSVCISWKYINKWKKKIMVVIRQKHDLLQNRLTCSTIALPSHISLMLFLQLVLNTPASDRTVFISHVFLFTDLSMSFVRESLAIISTSAKAQILRASSWSLL